MISKQKIFIYLYLNKHRLNKSNEIPLLINDNGEVLVYYNTLSVYKISI
jgi:hypothetical protein